MTLLLVTEDVVRILVGQRQRKTLDGAAGQRPVECGESSWACSPRVWPGTAACLAAALPVLLLMVPLGGPRSAAGSCSPTRAWPQPDSSWRALALVVSLNARSVRDRARRHPDALAFAWLFLPLLVIVYFLPRVWPAGSELADCRWPACCSTAARPGWCRMSLGPDRPRRRFSTRLRG